MPEQKTPAQRIVDEHIEVAFSLWDSWEDNLEPMQVTLIIGRTPSHWKDAIALGLVAGVFEKSEGEIWSGEMKPTAFGREVIEAFGKSMEKG